MIAWTFESALLQICFVAGVYFEFVLEEAPFYIL